MTVPGRCGQKRLAIFRSLTTPMLLHHQGQSNNPLPSNGRNGSKAAMALSAERDGDVVVTKYPR